MTTQELQNTLRAYQAGRQAEEQAATQDFSNSVLQNPELPDMQTEDDVQLGAPPASSPAAPTVLDRLRAAASANSPMAQDYTEQALEAGFGTSKYDTAFNPSMDLENNRAREQSAFSKIGTGLTKGAITAGATAVNTTLGTVFGIGSGLFELAFDTNGDGRSFMDTVDAGVNNYLSEQLINLQQWSEKALPNYRTAEERTEKYQKEWYKHMGTANFIGDSILKNFGFTVGAMAGGYGWTKLISRALSKRLAGDVLRGVAIASNGDEVASTELQRAAQALQRGTIVRVDASKLSENIRSVARRMNSANERLKLYGAAISAMGEGNMEGLMAKDEFLEEFLPAINKRYVDESKQLEKDMFDNNAPEYVTTRVEVQPDGSFKEVKVLTELGQNVLARQQEELTERYNELKEEAEREGQRLAGTTFLLNIPILTMSNTIQFGRLFTGGWKTNRAANVRGRLTVDGGNIAANYSGKGNKVVKSVLNTLKVAGSEAYEEMAQGTVSSGAKKVADYRLSSFNDAGYDPEATHSAASWFQNMYTGGVDYLGDIKNWQEGALGALTGLFGIPGRRWSGGVVEAIRDANEEVNASRAAADKLNQLVNSKEFQDQWHGYIRHLKYNNEMGEALDEDNQYAWHSANNKQLVSDIIAFADAGRLEDLNQIVDYYEQLNSEGVAGIRDSVRDSSGEEGWTKNLSDKEVIERVKKQAKGMRTAIDEYKEIYDALRSRAPQGTSSDILKELVFTAMQIRSFDRRFLQMFGETMDAIDPLLRAASEEDSNGQTLTKEQSAEQYRRLRDNYESILAGSLVPTMLPVFFQKQRDAALDLLEELTKDTDPELGKKIKDMRRLSEDRQKFFQKLRTLQTEEGVKQHEAEAITQEAVVAAADEAAVEEETQELRTVEDVKAQYFPKNAKERGQYVTQLMQIADKNPAAKTFVAIHELHYNFKRYVDRYISQLPTLAGDMSITPQMVIGTVNDLLRRANSVEDLLNLADNMFSSKAEFDSEYKSFFGLASDTAYDSTKKFLRKMMKQYRQLDAYTQSRNGSPVAPELPVPDMFVPEGRDASTPGSAAAKPPIVQQHDAEARNRGKKNAIVIDYEHPEKSIYFTVTSGGFHNVKPVSEEWHFSVADMRGKEDGWYEKDGNAYYIVHVQGRGGDNTTLWIHGVPTKQQKEAIAKYVNDLTQIEDSTYKDILDILAGVEEESSLPNRVSVSFTGKGGDKRVGNFSVSRDADGTIHIKRMVGSMQVRAFMGDLFDNGIEPEDITVDRDKYESYAVDEDTTEFKLSEVMAKPDGTIILSGKIGDKSATIDSATGSPIKILNTLAPEIADLLGVTNSVDAVHEQTAESSETEDGDEAVDNEISQLENLDDAMATDDDPFPESIETETVPSGERGTLMAPYYRTSVPEIDTGEARAARKALTYRDAQAFSAADLSDFVKAHPEYAEIWNYLSNAGAFTYVANELKVGDEVEIVIDPSFPTYKNEPQILVTTKKADGTRQILTVLSRQTNKYYGLSELRNHIMDKYNSFSAQHPNEVFVFGKSRVWAKRRGLVRYRRGENSEQPIAQVAKAKEWPVVFVTRGKLQVLRGDESALDALSESTKNRLLFDSQNERRNPGRLYLLMPLGDMHSYTPVRLGVEHFNKKTKNSSSAIFAQIRDSLNKIVEIVQSSEYVNDNAASLSEEDLNDDIDRHLEKVNAQLHNELKNLRAQLDIHKWFFSIKNIKNVGIALRINNGEKSFIRRPDQITSKWLINFIADKNLSLDVRSPKVENTDKDAKLSNLIQRVTTLIEEDLITSDADTTHPVGVDFYIDAWDDEAGAFRPITESQMAISDRIDREQTESTMMKSAEDGSQDNDDYNFDSVLPDPAALDEQLAQLREEQKTVVENAFKELSLAITQKALSTSLEVIPNLAKAQSIHAGDNDVVRGLVQSIPGTPLYKVYIDSKEYELDTPLHEYTHVWTSYLKAVNPEEWENVKALLDSVEGLRESTKELQPNLEGDALYEEMLAEYSGKHGAERLRSAATDIAEKEGKSVEESAKATSFLNTVREALKRFWKGVAELLGIHFTTAEEVADRILYDWASGFDANAARAEYLSHTPESVVGSSDDSSDFGLDSYLRLQIGKKRKDDMRAKLKNKLTSATDLQVEHTIEEIEKLGESRKAGGDPKIEKAALNWVLKGTVILPEDAPKVRQAVDIADKKHVDIQMYGSPMELINQFAGAVKSERINPDTVSTLSNKQTYPEGITVYDVEESEESRKNMREIISTHFGKDCSPWCLLQGDENGNLTEDSLKNWNRYNKYPKRVAFKDGKLLAFFASEDEPTWWDRADAPHNGIPVLHKSKNLTEVHVFNETTKKWSTRVISRGNTQNGTYEVFDSQGRLDQKREYKDGKLNGVIELYNDGLLASAVSYTDGVRDGAAFYYDSRTGKLKAEEHYVQGKLNGKAVYYSYGAVNSIEIHNVVDGVLNGAEELYILKDSKYFLIRRRYYVDGTLNGEEETWHSNGQLNTKATYKDGYLDGDYYEWNKHGELLVTAHFTRNLRNGLVEIRHLSDVLAYSREFPEINGLSFLIPTFILRQMYINGKLNGLTQKFSGSGTIQEEGAYRCGKPLGYHILYNKDGSVREIRWYSVPGHLARTFSSLSEATDSSQMPGVVAKQVEIDCFKRMAFSELFQETQEALLAKGYTEEEYATFSEYFKEKILQCL